MRQDWRHAALGSHRLPHISSRWLGEEGERGRFIDLCIISTKAAAVPDTRTRRKRQGDDLDGAM